MGILYLIIIILIAVCGASELSVACVSGISQSDCPDGTLLVENQTVFNCCPGCIERAEEKTGSCVASDSQIYPNCLEDGTYAPVQCKGDIFTGRCFCSDASGNRIYGEMWRKDGADDEMTCACSRHRVVLEAEGRTDVTLHCSSTGDYEHLQCDNGLCWCADLSTGQPITIVVGEDDMTLLPCYSTSVHGGQYLRRCESVVHALAVINNEQSKHGTTFFGNPVTFCNYDGSYAQYQNTNGILYCTSRTAGILGSWQAVASESTDMNCNCAFDSTVTFPDASMTLSQVCLANGNYRAYQQSGNYYYCVDSDGYATTDYLDELPSDYCGASV